MLSEADVETLATILTEAQWLAGSGEPRDQIEQWTRRSLHERLTQLPLTTGRALLCGTTPHRDCHTGPKRPRP